MGGCKGKPEWIKFKEGKPLSAKQAIKAQCFVCNGEEEGKNEDCRGINCPLYDYYKKWVLVKPKS